jgi:hypothetical protein
LKEQLSTAENDESWMMISIEEAMKGEKWWVDFQRQEGFETEFPVHLPALVSLSKFPSSLLQTEHWDEFFLKLHHQQILKEQLSTAENDESWMMISIEDCSFNICWWCSFKKNSSQCSVKVEPPYKSSSFCRKARTLIRRFNLDGALGWIFFKTASPTNIERAIKYSHSSSAAASFQPLPS